jgi:hypothetical protein
MGQSIIVYEDAGGYTAVTGVTRAPVFTSADAAATLQAAVDATRANGGHVLVEPGCYPLDRPVALRDRVQLRGSGRGTRLEVAGEAGVVMTGLDSAEVADLALVAAAGSMAEAGLIMDGCGDCQATNVFAGGFAGYGIWLRNHSFLCTIRGCSATGNARANIFLDTLATYGRAGRYLPNRLTDCMVYGGGVGIEVRRAVVLNISDCCVFQTRDSGFHVHTSSNSVIVTGCRTFQVGKHAVLVEDSDEFNLSSNIFCWHIEDGVVIRNANWGAITGNEIIDSGSYNSGVEDRTATWEQLPADLPPYSGLKLLNAHGYNVTGNTIFNWGVCPPMEYGIYEDAQSGKNNIAENNINFFVVQDAASLGSESVCKDNVSYGDRPHQDRAGLQSWFQTFIPAMKDAFIADQLAPEISAGRAAALAGIDPDPL